MCFVCHLHLLQDIYHLLDASIDEDAPITIREGGIFKTGYNEHIDNYRDKKLNSKSILAELEARERDKTGIKNLRIKFNRVFGYFLEVTNSYKSLVPDYFIRKQTLTNAERFTTDELSNLSSEILSAEENLYGLEYDEFVKLRDVLANETARVQKTAEYIATIDVLASLSYVAMHNNYVRPAINNDGVIEIENGRHPVIERMIGQGEFIPNDTFLDNQGNRIMIITGPNMAGKSTYMRQCAITVIMAQIGCFVPCREATLPIFDKIFTRIGASDDLVSGESTFMVEMKEANYAIENATENSLILFDELGRGTATYDGMSLAQAILEYIHDKIRAKTMFSTHYHELTVLEKDLKKLKNVHVSAVEENGRVTFLHKVKVGAVDKSYGIHVAALAHLPDSLIKRADEILSVYEKKSIKKETFTQTTLFELNEEEITPKKNEIEEKIKNINPLEMTPMDALSFLYEINKETKNKKN